MTKSVLHVDAPREHVYRILSDYESLPQWLPGCRRCTVLAAEGNCTDVQLVIQNMKTVTMELRFEAEPGQYIRFALTKSKDIRGYSGEYRLMDAANDSGTVILNEVEMDAGALVPRFMMDRMVKSALEGMGKALQAQARKYARSGAHTIVTGAAARKRKRRMLRIARTDAGTKIWYMGKVFK